MPLQRRWLSRVTMAVLSAAATMPAMAQTQPDTSAVSLWVDFNHYVRIARPDLASAAATTLLSRVKDDELLLLIETSEYKDWEQTIARASKIETLKTIAAQITTRVQEARVKRSREADRISSDITKLGEGERANLNAIERLRASGQFAAPALLSTLLDEGKKNLHPFVLAAMVSIGKPVVYPLATALPRLEPVPQTQIARVLAEIGYPRALPYLKQVIDNPKTEPEARKVAQAAYELIASNTGLPTNVTAAELFLTLGTNLYTSGTRGDAILGYDASADKGEGKGIVWSYTQGTGLIPIAVPTPIFADVLAMRAARTALELNPQLDSALSLWLTANYRRANRLPAGATDPSYPSDALPPAFYGQMAGPLRLHDILTRALDDRDTSLALNAITALTATAGSDALLNRQGTTQPLVRAISYPDRRIRFNAAFALANARPKAAFPGSHRVVPVLSEALRQGDLHYAIAIAKTKEEANKLQAVAKDLGFQVYSGTSLDEVRPQVNAGPGVDLIIAALPSGDVMELNRQALEDYKLSTVPILALSSQSDQIDLARTFANDSRIHSALATQESAKLKAAVEKSVADATGAAIPAEDGLKLASESLKILRELAVSGNGVYSVSDAQPALIEALLTDKRSDIAIAAAAVLSHMDSIDAQRALGDAALDATRTAEVRVALLNHLAHSSTLYGNRLNDLQLTKLLEIVKTSTGDLAITAARTHGSLTLPTSNVVQMITKEAK